MQGCCETTSCIIYIFLASDSHDQFQLPSASSIIQVCDEKGLPKLSLTIPHVNVYSQDFQFPITP